MLKFSDYRPIGVKPNDEEPTSIAFKDNDEQLSSLSIQDALEKFKMQSWTHQIWDKDKVLLGNDKRRKLKAFTSSSYKTEKCMAITPVASSNTGYGVVTIQPIKQGSHLVHSGICYDKPDNGDVFSYGFSSKNIKAISARDYGNIVRFMNHAFDEEDLEKEIVFASEEVRNQVALANFVGKCFRVAENISIIIMEAMRDIQEGEAIYCDIHLSYFDDLRTTPILLDKNQAAINPQLYYWKNTNIVFKDRAGEFIIDSVRQIIEGDSFYFVNCRKPYDLYMHANYLLQIVEETQALQRRWTLIESLPEDNPYIKYFTPQKENLAFLAKLYIATLGRILGDLFVKEEWSNTNEPILSATSSSHFYTKSTVFVCRTENTMDKVSLFQRRFIMAELKKDDDYFLNKVENSDTQYSLSISHSSLFKINSSCIAYYKTAAKDIYTPPDEIQWQGAMINNNIPTLWLELENNENYTHVLKQLKQHILTETHSNLEGDEIILIRKNKDTGNLVLRILDAREITKIHISRFAPGKCLTP